MPERRTPSGKGKAPSRRAGQYVHEEMEHVREGRHGARSARQAVAIGLSKARRAGVKVPSPPGKKAPRSNSAGRRKNPVRSQASLRALQREGTSAASHSAISRQTRRSAQRRGGASLRRAAQKAVQTKGAKGRRNAARKAARTRARHAA
jgi:hypothetical protein